MYVNPVKKKWYTLYLSLLPCDHFISIHNQLKNNLPTLIYGNIVRDDFILYWFKEICIKVICNCPTIKYVYFVQILNLVVVWSKHWCINQPPSPFFFAFDTITVIDVCMVITIPVYNALPILVKKLYIGKLTQM